MLGKLMLLGAGGVVAVAGVADVWAKGMAADKIAERAEATAGGQAQARADIDSFPFLLKLATSGNAGDISVTVEDLTAAELRFASVTLELFGVKLDRGKLFGSREAEVTDIDRGRLTMAVSASALSEALGGIPVTLADGRLEAEVAGRRLSATVAADGPGRFRIGFAGGPSGVVAIPRTALLACEPDEFRIDDEHMVFACSLEEVPPALLRAAQAGLRG